MNAYTLIRLDGSREEVPFLLQYGQQYVAPHIPKYEVCDKWSGEVVLFEPLITCFEETRKLIRRPITINSGYRTEAYQKHLKAVGYDTAEDSPHCRAAALDLGIPRGTTYLALTTYLKQAAKNLKLPRPRLGYKRYGYTFVHVDFVYMLFTPYTGERNPHPEVWKEGYEW